MKSMKINYPLRDVTFAEKSSDFAPYQPEYPCGLRLCLNDQAMKMLGITKLPEMGAKLKLNGLAEVVSMNSYKDIKAGGKEEVSMSMDLQITDLDISAGKKEPVKAETIYNADNVASGEAE